MKSRKEEQKLTDATTRTKKARFRIEKLEERIAPHSPKIYGPHDHGRSGCRPHDRGCGWL